MNIDQMNKKTNRFLLLLYINHKSDFFFAFLATVLIEYRYQNLVVLPKIPQFVGTQ